MALKPNSIGPKLLLGTVLPALVIVAGLLWLSLHPPSMMGSDGAEIPDWSRGLIQGSMAGVILLVVLTAAVTLVVVHLVITVRMRLLLEAMRRAEEGDFLVRVPEKGSDEVAQAGAAFNRLLARVIALRAEEIDQQRSLEEAQAQLQLQRTLAQRVQELTLLYGMAKQLASTLALEELLNRIIAMVHEKLDVPLFSVMLVNDEGLLEVRKIFPPERHVDGTCFQIGEGACGIAAEQGRAIYVPDVTADTTVFVQRPGTVTGTGSVLCIPLIHAGTLLGVLNFEHPECDAFSPEKQDALGAVAEMVSLAVRNARLHEETVTLSLTDPLTGLSNRRRLFQFLELELARSARFKHPASVIMIDIDHFKRLNDAAGHRAGDETLVEVASLLRTNLRKVDLLARYGGEEFVVVLSRADRAEALEVAEKLRLLVESTPFTHASAQLSGRVTVSLGIATYPLDASSGEVLVDQADAALYAAKRAGRNRATGFATGMEFHPGRERGLPIEAARSATQKQTQRAS